MNGNEAIERRRQLQESRLARFERMLEIRILEDRVKDLFAEGLIHGTTHTCQGQEAVAVGLAAASEPTDHVVCTYRGHGVALALGVEVSKVLGEIAGRTTGVLQGIGGSMHLVEASVGLLPTMAIVGAGIPIAVGAALSAKLGSTGAIAVSVFGDGATNIGAFHEGLNLASIWKLPVVFVCENNLYGEYTRIDRSTPIPDIADRAAAYGIPGHVVDGQDIDAVVAAMTAAASHARIGAGPQLLEMKTYRYSGHSRADPATYRPEGELEEWLRRDPIELFAEVLVGEGTDAAELDSIRRATAATIETEIEAALVADTPSPADMFRHVIHTEQPLET